MAAYGRKRTFDFADLQLTECPPLGKADIRIMFTRANLRMRLFSLVISALFH